jgi:mRNA-degrading endonuclease YafQ of YafQ-DinJ toxin-antitoxin module
LIDYKEKILKDMEKIPESKLPTIYMIIHILINELALEKSKKRASLKGIWKGIKIDDSLINDAKKSMFYYEYK